MAPKAVAKKGRKAVAENARTTYRRTAVQFDQLAQTAQMPKSVRALAEKSVAQTRELYVHSLEAVLESWKSFIVAAGRGAVALNRKAIDIARRNINDGFRLAESLAGAKNIRSDGIADSLLAQAGWCVGISSWRDAHAIC